VSGVTVSACPTCGWRGFPRRLWCPNCGGDRLYDVAVDGGVVEELTCVHRAAGRARGTPVRLATVRLDGGGHVIARVGSVREGVRVQLDTADDGAILAQHVTCEVQ
jgi:uncharacterized protein